MIVIRTAILVLALTCALSAGAFGDEIQNWEGVGASTTLPVPANSGTVKKAIDIIEHAGGLRAVSHDDVIYAGTYNAATKTTGWSTQHTIANTAGGAQRDATQRTRTWPQMASFDGKLYVARCYQTRVCGPDYNHTIRPYWFVLEIDGDAEAVSLQVAGTSQTQWSNHCSYPVYNPTKDTMVGGYLFTNAGSTTLYWGGGGTDFRYVYSKTAGNAWVCANRTLGNDEYGRAVPAAMPSGYRYSHLVEFKGSYYDYYGVYDANLNFTPYAVGSPHTEPWGWFIMGKDTNSLYRVAHNKKGNRNYIFTNPGNTGWTQLAGSDNPAGGGVIYWRGCAAISDNANTKHNGLYCTYSKDGGGGNFESGVYRYSDPTGAGAPAWSRCVYFADARVYTGGIYIKKDDAIYVGTTNGIVRRGIGPRTPVPGPPNIIVNPDPDEPQP